MSVGSVESRSSGSCVYGFLSGDMNGMESCGLYAIGVDGSYDLLWHYPDAAESGIILSEGWFDNGKLCGLVHASIGGMTIYYGYQEIDLQAERVLKNESIDYSDNYLAYFTSPSAIIRKKTLCSV